MSSEAFTSRQVRITHGNLAEAARGYFGPVLSSPSELLLFTDIDEEGTCFELMVTRTPEDIGLHAATLALEVVENHQNPGASSWISVGREYSVTPRSVERNFTQYLFWEGGYAKHRVPLVAPNSLPGVAVRESNDLRRIGSKLLDFKEARTDIAGLRNLLGERTVLGAAE